MVNIANMPLCRPLLILFFAGLLTTVQVNFFTFALTNFAHNREVIVSLNSTCGYHGIQTFCSAVNELQHCRHEEDCDARCPFGEEIPRSVDLVAKGSVYGEVTYINKSSPCYEQNTDMVKFNGTNGFITVLPEVLSQINGSDGITFTIWFIKQELGDTGDIITTADSSNGVTFSLSTNSSNETLLLKYKNTSGLRSISRFMTINTSLVDDKCLHIAVVLFRSTIQLYLDGTLAAEESTYKDLWRETGRIFIGGAPNATDDRYFKGEIGSVRLFFAALLPSEIKATAGQDTRRPRLAPQCRCDVDYPSVSLDDGGLYCINARNQTSVRRLSLKSHYEGFANDGDPNTWWQSITNPGTANVTVDIGGLTQILLVNISFKWWPPQGMVLLRSIDNGTTWSTWQYFAQNCREIFHLENQGLLRLPDSVNCVEGFSYRVSGETVSFYLLEPFRPGSDGFLTNLTLQNFSYASHVRLSMVSLLGNSSEKTDYFSISEFGVYGRNCSCTLPGDVTSCRCEGSVLRPPQCNETLAFDRTHYARSVFNQTPTGVPILQVHAKASCTSSPTIKYFVVERNDSGSFHLNNSTGVLTLQRQGILNSAYTLLIRAELRRGTSTVNSTVPVTVHVVPRASLSSRATVDFRTKNVGYLRGKRSNLASQFGFFVNNYPSSEGILYASVGAVTAQANYSASREPAVYVKAALVSDDVWYNRPAVHVVAQVQDAAFNVRALVDESEVVVKVTPNAKLASIDGSLIQVMSTPSSTTGIAQIEVPLPYQWFTDSSITQPEVVIVAFRLRNSNMALVPLGNVTINPETKTPLHQNDVYGVLPTQTVYIGGTFKVTIYCDSSYAIASFGIKLFASSSLAIVKSTVDGQHWVHVAANHTSSEWAVSATLVDPEAAPQGYVTRERLVSFDVKVKESADVGTNATLMAEVSYLSNVNNEEIQIGGQTLPVMAAMIDGFDQSRDTIGTIHIESNDVRELLPYVEPSELVNTAVLNGKGVSSNVKLLSVLRSGDVMLLPAANCTSLSRAVQVTENCSKVFLNGSEPHGSAAAVVQVKLGNLTANVSVRVWYPILPLNLTLQYPDLAEISGWLEFNASSGRCVQRHQWSEILSETVFTYDGIQFENVSTTNLVRDLLTSSNETVAFIGIAGRVFGLSPGQAVIIAISPVNGVVLASTVVVVTSSRLVSVQLIDLVMVTNLSVSITSPPFPKRSTQIAEASVHQDLRRDHSRGSIVVYVTFDDNRRQELAIELGLRLRSLDEHVLRVVGQSEAISVGSGSGMLQADWALPPSMCHPKGFSLGVGYEMTNVSLSSPVSLEITGVQSQITVEGDSSTIAGIPTSSPIKVTLVFDNGHRVDMSSDSRTVYDLSQSEGFFTVDRDANNRPTINANKQDRTGKKPLVVRFTHFSISKSILINVVKYLSLALQAKPYPPYPGSKWIADLNPIAGTISFEMASLSLIMVMSDASQFDVTTHDLTSYSSTSPNVTVGHSAANRVTVTPGVTSSLVVLEGRFGSIGVSAMYMSVTNSPVNVTSITDVILSPENNQTLSGLENSVVAHVQLGLIFTNGRRVTEFFNRGSQLFPGLISLTSENSQVFAVDSSTGQITLRQNYHQALSLTATATVSVVMAKVSLACNLQPGIGDVDIGEEYGPPLPPRRVDSSFQVAARLNAGGGSDVTTMDLSLSYDSGKLSVDSVAGGKAWDSCVLDLNTPGVISLDCIKSTPLTGLVHVALISFNATSPGMATFVGDVTTNLGSQPVVAGNVDQEILDHGLRKRRSNAEHVFLMKKRRIRRSAFCANPPCQCDSAVIPGDVNKDCRFDLSDVLFVLEYYTFSLITFSSVDANHFVQSLRTNQSRDLDVDKNTVVNPADAFFLVRARLGLIAFVSSVTVIPVQELHSECMLTFNVTLKSKDGPVSDKDASVFFDITYKGASIDFAGSTGSPRAAGVHGNVIRGISNGSSSFSVQAPFELIQNSIGLSIFHMTLDANNQTSVRRSFALVGSSRPPYLFPFRLSVDLQFADQSVGMTSSHNYNPFLVFNNTLTSADCPNVFTPQFDQLVYYANVSENATLNTSVVIVNATDRDTGKSGKLRYSLVNAESLLLPFTINSTSGILSVIGPLDREKKAVYNVTVRATDGGAPGREKFTDAHVIVTLTDVNDNAPSITDVVPGYVIKVPENSVVGNRLLRVIASDPDVEENARLQYSLKGNTSQGLFLMNTTTGDLTLNKSLHGRVGETFVILLFVSDNGVPSLFVNSSVEIRITFALDVDVFFTSKSYSANVTENSARNTSVLRVSAHVPGLPFASIVYSLNDNSSFDVGPMNGIVRVNSKIDRESNPSFILTVIATYGKNTSTNATLNITVLDQNDNAPYLIPVLSQVIPFNLPVNSEVFRINATDRDIAENAALVFRVVENVTNSFVVDEKTGAVLVGASLFHLNVSFVQLVVEVSDSGFPPLSNNMTVNISVVFPPRFACNISNISVLENVTVGHVVQTFSPQGVPGRSDEVFFTITSGSYNGKFSIQNSTGEVSVKAMLDREQKSFYSLQIQASNLAVERFTSIQPTQLQLNITLLDVNDNAPYFEAIPPITIKNTARVGYTLAHVNASDADEGLNAQIQYRITSGNELQRFFINESGYIQLNSSLLYDKVPLLQLTINVSDLGFPKLFNTAIVNITVLDDRSAPQFNQTVYNVSLPEDSPPGSHVVTVFAEDPNRDEIHYNISSQLLSVVSTFYANSSSGVVSLLATIDREMEEVYQFHVVAYKSSPLTGQTFVDNATVVVRVLDVNDVPPHFLRDIYVIDIHEGNLPRLVLTTVAANDSDAGSNAQLTYSFVAGNKSVFSINSSSGEITVLQSLDYEAAQQMNLTAMARDHGMPPLEGNTTVVVNILDVNDNPPLVDPVENLTLFEKISVNAFVVQVNASDADSGPNAALSFSITEGNVDDAFYINSSTGVLRTRSPLDYERKPFYTLNVTVRDQGTPPLSSSILVWVRLVDVNDLTPTIQSVASVHVKENVPVGTVILRLNATDGDTGVNAMLNFTIVSGDQKGDFVINETNGVISTAHALDHENTSSYSINVSVSDNGVPALSSSVVIVIHVVDVNDHRPIFSQELYEVMIHENATLNSTVLRVVARDLDSSTQSAVVYSIKKGNTNDTFLINSTSGEIQLARELDFENTETYLLIVEATDTFFPNQTMNVVGSANDTNSSVSFQSYANVSVSILDVNDNPPRFSQSFYSALISSNLMPGSSVTHVLASDRDSGENSDIFYELLSGFGSEYFVINASSGQVATSKTLRDANYLTLELSIRAWDGGVPALNSSVLLQVHIQYAVIYKGNETSPIKYSIHEALSVVSPTMLNRLHAEVTLGLFSRSSGVLRVSVGHKQTSIRFEVVGEAAESVKAVVVSSWPDYQEIRIASLVFDRSFASKIAPSNVFFKITNLRMNSTVHFTCVPSALTGICVVSFTVPREWLNISSEAIIEYGLSPSQMAELNRVSFVEQQAPQVEENFLLVFPSFLLHIDDTFIIEAYGQFPKPIRYFTLLCTISTGISIRHVESPSSWTVQVTFNGPVEFSVSGVRKGNFVLDNTDFVTHFFSLVMEINSEADVVTSSEMECVVLQVSDLEGNQVIDGLKKAVFSDRFGINSKGRFLIVNDKVQALFVVPDFTVVINTAVLTGKQIVVPFNVLGVTALGRVVSVTSNISCRSHDVSSLKVAGDCRGVYVDGSETKGSFNALVELTYSNLTTNVVFIVWIPSTSIFLSVTPAKLRRIRDWFDYRDSCKSRYQQARIVAKTNFTNGKETVHGVDVTQYIKDYLESSNSSVADVVNVTVLGRSKGKATIKVFVYELGQLLGEVDVEVTDEDVRVYVLDAIVATRLSVGLLQPLNASLNDKTRIYINESFYIAGEEGSIIVSAQYSDGVVNTFDSLDGFLTNSTNSSIVEVDGDRATAIGNGSGSLINVTMHSSYCSQEVVFSSLASMQVSLIEPVAIQLTLSSKQITPVSDSAEALGIPLISLLTVMLVYNISGEVQRVDVSNDSRTILNMETGSDLVHIALRPDGIGISSSGRGLGEVEISIRFMHVKLSSRVAITVVGTKGLQLYASVYRPVISSSKANITQLNPLGNSGVYQRATLHLTVVLSNDSKVDISRDLRTQFAITSSQPPALAQSSRIWLAQDGDRVLSIQWKGGTAQLSIKGDFEGKSSEVLTLLVKSDPVTVTGVELDLASNLTLKGVRGMATLQLSVNLEFNDSSKLFGLFTSENTTLLNLVTFSTQDVSKVSLNTTYGLVTLLANSPEYVQVTATTLQSPHLADSVTFACNLDPDVGDVDIGEVSGIPLKAVHIGERFTVSVRTNSGEFVLGSFDIYIVYDNERLKVISVSEGPDMSGFFIADVSSAPGQVRIAGALRTERQDHSLRHIADVTFQPITDGISRIRGVVAMVARDDIVGTVIGAPVPRDIIAGDVEVKIDVSSDRKRRFADHESEPSEQSTTKIRETRAVVTCPTPPCSSCPNGTREPRDVDGNCIFDVRDVKFALIYITEQHFNFSRAKGQEIKNSITSQQLQALDSDGDGVVSLDDVNLLFRAHLKTVSLSPSVEVVPVESPQSSCLLKLSVSLSDLDVKRFHVNRTRMYFDVTHEDVQFSAKLHDSDFTIGSLEVIDKGSAIHGGIIRAAFNSDTKNFEAVLNTSLVFRDIGLSIIQVTFTDDGAIDYTRTTVINGRYTRPPLYGGALNATLNLGDGRLYSIKRPNGYNPYTFFNNSLPSANCSDEPLLERSLSLYAAGARSVVATWKLRNARHGLNFSFFLVLQQCDPAQINEPCYVLKEPVWGLTHTVRGLTPYTNYSVTVQTVGLPLRETRPENVRTLEAAPLGVEAPALKVTSSSSLNASWTLPKHPNGVITSYSLHMRNSSAFVVVYMGLNLSYHVTGLVADEQLFFFIMANTSMGGTKSPVTNTTLPLPVTSIPTASTPSGTGLSVEVIVALSVGSVAFIVILVAVIIFLVRRKKNKNNKRFLEYHSLQKYHSLNAYGQESFPLETRLSSGLDKEGKRGRRYEHQFTIQGLENPWHQQYVAGDSSHDVLAAVDHGTFETDTVRNDNWDPGYEETVLREAVQEMGELDATVKVVENTDSEWHTGGLSGQQLTLQHDNLVRMTRLSSSQSSLSPHSSEKKKSKKKKEGKEPVSEGAVEWDYYLGKGGFIEDGEETMDTKSRGQIRKARQLALDMLQRLANGEVNREFLSMAAERTDGSYLCANNPINLPKNRYKNVLPFDHSRVTLLDVDPEQEGADYVNASFLDGFSEKNFCIASQGPLDSTISDFWQMIWEQNVHVILMLTRLQEGKKVKCVKYWPDTEEEVKFGDFSITSTYKRKLESRVTRRFILENTGSGECRELSYFQFTAWPDFGIPSSPVTFLELYYEVSQVYKSLPVAKTPMLVHCSAGVGRTGAFCTISNALQSFRATGKIDVAETVRRLRQQRYGLVQTLEQYVFCYKCLVLALLYQIRLRKLRGTSLLSQSTVSGVLTTPGDRSSSPDNGSVGEFSPTSRLQSPELVSSSDSVTTETAPSFSDSQRTLPPVGPNEELPGVSTAGVNDESSDFPAVIVHLPPKANSSPDPSITDQAEARDRLRIYGREEESQNAATNMEPAGRRHTTGNIRRRPNLGVPPPPPPPPPSTSMNEDHLSDEEMLPELPDLEQLDLALSEYDAPLPPLPEEFCLAVGSEQAGLEDSTA